MLNAHATLLVDTSLEQSPGAFTGLIVLFDGDTESARRLHVLFIGETVVIEANAYLAHAFDLQLLKRLRLVKRCIKVADHVFLACAILQLFHELGLEVLFGRRCGRFNLLLLFHVVTRALLQGAARRLLPWSRLDRHRFIPGKVCGRWLRAILELHLMRRRR